MSQIIVIFGKICYNFYINNKKCIAESHRLHIETYDEQAFSESIYISEDASGNFKKVYSISITQNAKIETINIIG